MNAIVVGVLALAGICPNCPGASRAYIGLSVRRPVVGYSRQIIHYSTVAPAPTAVVQLDAICPDPAPVVQSEVVVPAPVVPVAPPAYVVQRSYVQRSYVRHVGLDVVVGPTASQRRHARKAARETQRALHHAENAAYHASRS